VLFAAHLSAVSPQSFVFLQSALVLMAVVLGGMGNMRGVVVGAVAISLLPEFLRDLGNLRYVVFGVVLVAVMVLRPQGFWPSRAYEPDRNETEGRRRRKGRKSESLDQTATDSPAPSKTGAGQ
jgi:branched-chain amino acid transport system permease protein